MVKIIIIQFDIKNESSSDLITNQRNVKEKWFHQSTL